MNRNRPSVRLRIGAWYGDREIDLPLPAAWQVSVRQPPLQSPLTDAEIAERLATPIGQPPIAELARGKSRPIIIVDDLNRPTPAARVLPPLLRQLERAGIPSREVRVIMAPGTHGRPPADGMVKKVGAEVAAACQLLVHDCHRDLVRIGRTRFGTPVSVSRDVADSDLVIAVGGLYPNYTAGFGGGSKQVLGVLGFRSIAGLHFGHDSMGWGTPNTRSNFRRDLDEMARMIGLTTTISVILNAHRDIADVQCGDWMDSYSRLLSLARELYRADPPDAGADVVIVNAYPGDLSLTFARMKGLSPFRDTPAGASRVFIAACPEGLGFHGLFPFLNAPAGHRRRVMMLRARVLARNPRRLASKVSRRLARPFRPRRAPVKRLPMHLYRPNLDQAEAPFPARIPGMVLSTSWERIVEAVNAEQGGREALRVFVYPCASLQWVG